jgi:hypothetical protein
MIARTFCDPVLAPRPETYPVSFVTLPATAVYFETSLRLTDAVSVDAPIVVVPNVPDVCCVKFAVYVVAFAGAVTVWLAAPPSDQELKTYVPDPIVCGESALSETLELTTTVFVNGAGPLVVPAVSWAPAGDEASVRSTVCGSSRTLVVALNPFESVAVSWSSSQHGYSWSGALKVPLETPANVCTLCVWQLLGVGQWWMISSHDRPDAGIVPSCASVAPPEKEIGSPTFQVSVDAGDEIVGTGAVLPASIVIGALTVEAPCESVTLRWTTYVPAVWYVNDGCAAVESPYVPSPFRSQE